VHLLTLQTAEVVDQVEKTFRDECYSTTRIMHAPNTHCVDVIATTPDRTKSLVTKIVENIDGTSKDLLFELMLLGYFLRATPIVVGIYNRRSELEDNTVYFRLDGHIIAFNLNTFMQIIKHQVRPQKIAHRGGYMYQINGEELKHLRENQSISRKYLSDALDISTKTIAEYERRKIVNSQVRHVEMLEDILHRDLRQGIGIYDYPKKPKKIVQNKPSPHAANTEIAQEVSDILSDLNIFQFWTSNSPFDVFLVIPREETKIQVVSGIFSSIQREDLSRLQKIAQIVKIRNKMGAVRAIVEDRNDVKQCKEMGVIPIESKKLKEAKKPQEIAKILSMR
jgi:predicted transcriptional regulator